MVLIPSLAAMLTVIGVALAVAGVLSATVGALLPAPGGPARPAAVAVAEVLPTPTAIPAQRTPDPETTLAR